MHQPDLNQTLQMIRQGDRRPEQEMDQALAVAHSPACEHAYLKLFDENARQQVREPRRQALPLAGLPVSVKDLFDLEGQTTAAGSRVLEDAPTARQDAAAVARLKAAGATVNGRTNMTEFAFSGVGTNPHFATPVNPADAHIARIPGGSSSGAAVSVATGAAFIGLGSDTGGSIRIPAALCGIVGFKNTARLTPAEGALPLSTTLDTACALTRSVRDAILAHEVLSGRAVRREARPVSSLRLAVPTTLMFDGIEPAVARAFERSISALAAAGAQIQAIPLELLGEQAAINATGGFSAAESYAWHRRLLEQRGAAYDPRVRVRIERGAAMKAWEYIELAQARRAWIDRMELAMRGFDALLSPTVPMVAPSIAQLAPADGKDAAQDAVRDAEFMRINALLLRNTSTVNLLDGCAISIPCHAAGELPVGLMIWQGALRDEAVLNIALQIESTLATTRRD